MSKEIRSTTFKSGNSVALRLPKALGIKVGVEMTVREEQGHYLIEPIRASKTLDLSGIAGSAPGIKRLAFEEKQREWDGKASKLG